MVGRPEFNQGLKLGLVKYVLAVGSWQVGSTESRRKGAVLSASEQGSAESRFRRSGWIEDGMIPDREPI